MLDEPNSNLDEEGDRALLASIKLMKQLGSTVIMVSHRQNALPLSDYLIILAQGRITQQGKTSDVVSQIKKRMADARQLEANGSDKEDVEEGHGG